jgi:hypothetical protein
MLFEGCVSCRLTCDTSAARDVVWQHGLNGSNRNRKYTKRRVSLHTEVLCYMLSSRAPFSAYLECATFHTHTHTHTEMPMDVCLHMLTTCLQLCMPSSCAPISDVCGAQNVVGTGTSIYSFPDVEHADRSYRTLLASLPLKSTHMLCKRKFSRSSTTSAGPGCVGNKRMAFTPRKTCFRKFMYGSSRAPFAQETERARWLTSQAVFSEVIVHIECKQNRATNNDHIGRSVSRATGACDVVSLLIGVTMYGSCVFVSLYF